MTYLTRHYFDQAIPRADIEAIGGIDPVAIEDRTKTDGNYRWEMLVNDAYRHGGSFTQHRRTIAETIQAFTGEDVISSRDEMPSVVRKLIEGGKNRRDEYWKAMDAIRPAFVGVGRRYYYLRDILFALGCFRGDA